MRAVYLAGPDVFRLDNELRIRALNALCAELDLRPLIPKDAPGLGAEEIVALNLERVARSDVVVANLAPFRGFEPDSGTCFECGYAVALGKPVIGYLPDHRPLIDKAREAPWGPPEGTLNCPDGTFVEDLGQPVNIMLALRCRLLRRSVEEALEAAAALEL